jgi:hypothetical protein
MIGRSQEDRYRVPSAHLAVAQQVLLLLLLLLHTSMLP